MKRLAAIALVAACGGGSTPTGSATQTVWTNGDFESDSIGTEPPTGWTLETYLNPGITDLRPGIQTLPSLNLSAGGAAAGNVVGGAAETQVDPDVGSGGTLRFPKYGSRASIINKSASVTGTGRNVNSLKQQMTVSIGDVDPTDNKVHVRFAVAPVLENPSHSYTSQPYYFVRLQNLTTGQTLYSDFNASGQPGVPWKNFTDTSGQAAQYTDWQLVDISPGNAQLAVGDQVELFVLAAGCSAGGHWGRLYVDAVGSGIPGLFAWATGAQQVNEGTDLIYTVNYKNGGTTTTSGTALDLVTPPNTVYKATSGTGCTEPSVGATGTVSCPLGTLAPGATGSFTVTVTVPSGTAAGSLITNGNYSIYATGISALVGPKVYTTVTSGVQYANLGITKTDGVAALAFGQATTYTIVVSNAGPLASTATVADTMPAQLTGVTWTCTGAGGGTCAASGSGDISDSVSLPVGATLTYTVQGTTISGSGTASMVNTATVTATGGISDPDSTNNTAVDTDTLGTLRTLTVNKGGAASGGTVSSTPAAIDCGTGCSSASADFLDGSQVMLTAAPVPGASFSGWGGACSGTATTCTVTMSAATTVTATFVGAPSSTAVSSGSPQSTNTSSAFGLPLAVLVTDANGTPVSGVTVSFSAPGSGASASLSAATATTNASGIAQVTATANATAGSYAVTASVSGVATPASFALTNVGVPASIAVQSGSGQSATVNTAFASSLVAIVLDASSNPVSGATVTFSAPGSGARATLGAATATTDASGHATISATAGTVAGSYTVTATVTGVATGASFTLTNTAGAAASLTAQSGGGQSATVSTAFAQPLVVRVADAFGNAVSGVALTFSAAGSGASAALSSSSGTSSASGLAQITATANTTAGAHSVTASSTGLTSVTFSLTNTAGAPAAIAITGGNSQSATVHTAFAQALTVQVTDAFGNAAPSATVTFTPPASGATATVTTTTTTNASGVASTAATAGDVAGSYSVTAAITGHSATFSLTNVAGAPATVSFTAGGSQSTTVGTAFAQQARVLVVDAFGNPAPSATVTFTGPGSGAGLATSPLTATTNASGVALVTLTANQTAGSYSVSAAVTGVAGSPTISLTNTAGTATALAIVSGNSQHATVTAAFGQALVVRATDSFGNNAPGAQVTFSTTGSASFSPATTTTAANGQASTTATAGTTAGAYSVTAAITGASVTFTLTNDPGAAAAVTIVSGDGQSATVDTAFADPLVVHVTDAHGNDVPSVTVTFSAPASGARAILSSATATTGATGRCQITATASQVAGSYLVHAQTTGASAADAPFTNTPGEPATLAATGGDHQSAVVLTAFGEALRAHAADAFGNPVPGATITFTPPSSGASASLASGGTATTDASGDAELAVTAGSVTGSYAVVATTGTATAASFALTNLPGAAVAIAVVSGSDQSATVATAFAQPLRARVTDAQGNVVPAATVRFVGALSAAHATVAAPTAATDADGIAEMAATASTAAGAHDVVASLASGATAAFLLTNTAGAPASIEALESASPQQMTVLHLYAAPLAVRVRDAFGNVTPGATVTFSAPATSPSATLSSTTATTDATGGAFVTATADIHQGAYLVYADVAGVTERAAFSLTNTSTAPYTLSAQGGDAQTTTVATDFPAPLAVRVLDAGGSPVAGAVVTFTAPSAAATASMSTNAVQTDGDGVAQVTAHASNFAGSYQVTASLAGAATPVHFALTNEAGHPVAIVASPASTPQHAQLGQPLARPLVARVVDEFGNGVPGVTVQYAPPTDPVTGALSTTTVTSDPDGYVTVLATAGAAAGDYQVTASVDGLAGPAAFDLGNLGGPPYTVTAHAGAPQSAPAGTAFAQPLVARVTDETGAPAVGVTVTFHVPDVGPTGSLDQDTAVTGADGTAQVTLTAGGQIGDLLVTATADLGAAPALFPEATLAGGPATAIILATASPQSTEVLHAFAQPLSIAVVDSFGNRVPNAAVTFTAPSVPGEPGAQLSATSVTTDSDGVAQILAIATQVAGTYTVTADLGGGASATFTLANTPAAPAHVLVASGAAQYTLATTAFPQPITVRVVDAYGNPIAGAPVNISMPNTGPTALISDADPVTDADGYVTFRLTAGPTVGAFVVAAATPGAQGAGTTTLEIRAIPTATTAASDAMSPVDLGTTVTVDVGAALGVPSGEVQLVDAAGKVVATGTLSSGRATIDITGLPMGTYSVYAQYAAQGSYGASASTPVTFTITEDSRSLSGGGCSSSRAPSSALLLVLVGLWLARRARRTRLAVASASLAGLLAATALTPTTASADPPGARALSRYHAPTADSAWFAVDSASFAGERDVTLSFVGDYASEPLQIFDANGNAVEQVVSDAMIVQLGASIVLLDLVRLSGTVPVSPWQDGGATTYNGMPLSNPSGAFGDVTVAGDVRVAGSRDGAWRLAVGARFGFPTGSRTHYMSDGRFSVEPRVLAAGTTGLIEYAASASAHLRASNDVAGNTFGSELRYQAAAGVRLAEGRVLVGPELLGAVPLIAHSDIGTPLEAQLGLHVQATRELRLGLGGGVGLVNAIGEPTWRMLLSLGWMP